MKDAYSDPRYNSMNHLDEDLAKLWDLIKGSKCPDGDGFKGLSGVFFGVGLTIEEFFKDYNKVINNKRFSRTPFVETNLKKVFEILKNSEISSYHLSCASFRINNHDTALSIYFKKNGEYCAVGIPGINYKK